MAQPKACILTGYGINCDHETQFALTQAGFETKCVHVNDLIDGLDRLTDYQLLAFPGGFSYGDDIAAGRVLGNRIRTRLHEPLLRFVEEDRLVIGICNGFQVMANLGLFSYGETQTQTPVTLSYNDSGRYEDRWVHLKEQDSVCVFTQGLGQVYYPVAHGEGKFVASEETLVLLNERKQVALRYCLEDGSAANGQFPASPNGSREDIAGICDPTGRIFGMMPHPERFLNMTNHPTWTRLKDMAARRGQELSEEGQGRKIFANARGYFK